MQQPQDDAISARGDASLKLKPSAQSFPGGPAQCIDSGNLLDLSKDSSKRQNNFDSKDNHACIDPLPSYHMEASSTGVQNHHDIPEHLAYTSTGAQKCMGQLTVGDLEAAVQAQKPANHSLRTASEPIVEGRTADSAAGPALHDTPQDKPIRRWSFGRGQVVMSMDSSRVPSDSSGSNSTAILRGLQTISGGGTSSTSSNQTHAVLDCTTSTLVSTVDGITLPAGEDPPEMRQGPAETGPALLQHRSTSPAAAAAAAEGAAPAALQLGGYDQLSTCTQASSSQAGQQGGHDVQVVQPAVLPSQLGIIVQEQPQHLQEIQTMCGADATSSRTQSNTYQQVTAQDHELSQQQQGGASGAAKQHHQEKNQQHGLPMPALIILGVAAAGAAFGLALVLIRKVRQGVQAGDDNIFIDEVDAAFEAQIKTMEEEEKKAAAADAAAAAADDDTSAAMSAEEAELAAKQAEAAKKERILAAALAQEDAEMAKIDALHSDDLLELGEDELAELEAELAALEES